MVNQLLYRPIHVDEQVLVFRTMTVLGVAVGDAVWLKSSLSTSSILGLIVITLGGVIYGYYDVAYDPTGYMWATAYWATMVANSLHIKMVFNQSKSMSTCEKSYLNNLMTVGHRSLLRLTDLNCSVRSPSSVCTASTVRTCLLASIRFLKCRTAGCVLCCCLA